MKAGLTSVRPEKKNNNKKVTAAMVVAVITFFLLCFFSILFLNRHNIHIQLIKWNTNIIFVKGFFDIFQNTPAGFPVFFCLYPVTNPHLHAAFFEITDVNGKRFLRQEGRLFLHYLFKNLPDTTHIFTVLNPD